MKVRSNSETDVVSLSVFERLDPCAPLMGADVITYFSFMRNIGTHLDITIDLVRKQSEEKPASGKTERLTPQIA